MEREGMRKGHVVLSTQLGGLREHRKLPAAEKPVLRKAQDAVSLAAGAMGH